MSETNEEKSNIVFVSCEPNWRENFPDKKLIFRGEVVGFGESRSSFTKARKQASDTMYEQLEELGSTICVIVTDRVVGNSSYGTCTLRGNAYVAVDKTS